MQQCLVLITMSSLLFTSLFVRNAIKLTPLVPTVKHSSVEVCEAIIKPCANNKSWMGLKNKQQYHEKLHILLQNYLRALKSEIWNMKNGCWCRFFLIPRLKAHVLISNKTSSMLKKTMKESILMAENSSIHEECIEEILINIETLIFCSIHGFGAHTSDIVTCAFKRGISILS